MTLDLTGPGEVSGAQGSKVRAYVLLELSHESIPRVPIVVSASCCLLLQKGVAAFGRNKSTKLSHWLPLPTDCASFVKMRKRGSKGSTKPRL